LAQSATAGEDFHPVLTTYNFQAGETDVSLVVQIFDNVQFQTDRQFKVTLSNPVNLTLGSPAEIAVAVAIERSCGVPVTNLAGKDTLPQLLALIERACVVLTPDSGPAHMATMVGTPVIGLYAATRAARTGPYLSRQWCVDRYAEAAQRYRHCDAAALGWHEDIRDAGVMDLITVGDVVERLDALMADRAGSAPR
jgi:hypothetical protein